MTSRGGPSTGRAQPQPSGHATLSGRALVLGGALLVAVLFAATVLAGPGLRDAVLQESRPRTLREPIATGQAARGRWEAVARFDGTANCVELRYLEQTFDRACDTGTGPAALPDVGLTTLPGAAPVVYGVAAERVATVRVAPAGGAPVEAAVKAAELGFPVGFWATEVAAGGERGTVTALDAGGAVLATRRYGS